jgi:sugar phosphate isomerase/epimerase
MARAKGRIAAFHVCDWKVPTTDLVLDRGLPGEGVIDIPAIRAMAEASGWTGGVEVEILSSHWWAQDPEHVLREVKACQAFC